MNEYPSQGHRRRMSTRLETLQSPSLLPTLTHSALFAWFGQTRVVQVSENAICLSQLYYISWCMTSLCVKALSKLCSTFLIFMYLCIWSDCVQGWHAHSFLACIKWQNSQSTSSFALSLTLLLQGEVQTDIPKSKDWLWSGGPSHPSLLDSCAQFSQMQHIGSRKTRQWRM